MAKIVDTNGKKCMAMNGKSGDRKQARRQSRMQTNANGKENCL